MKEKIVIEQKKKKKFNLLILPWAMMMQILLCWNANIYLIGFFWLLLKYEHVCACVLLLIQRNNLVNFPSPSTGLACSY